MAGKIDLKLPKAPTSVFINLIGLMSFFFSIAVIRLFGDHITNFQATIICLAFYAVPVIILELVFLKTYKRASTGIDFSKQPSIDLKRVGTKYLGLLGTLGFAALIYWLFPEYRGRFYQQYYYMLQYAVPILLTLAVPYFFIIDRYMVQPEDGFYMTGLFFLGKWRELDRKKFGQHILGWVVKLFFLPLMYTYFSGKIRFFLSFNPDAVTVTYKAFYDFMHSMIFAIDLLLVTVGYLLTIRLFDSHIRTTEPTLLGWFVALECYQPFWGFTSRNYFHYFDKQAWGYWFFGTPMYPYWGSAILILLLIYVWATLPFGIRFSNLTNRGILTNGPYRFSKHPAYVSKNLAWWLISMPFMTTAPAHEALRHSLLLLLVNLVYFMRARTEERHLSKDPTYVTYAERMEQAGMLRWVGKMLPIIRYKKGQLFNI